MLARARCKKLIKVPGILATTELQHYPHHENVTIDKEATVLLR
jgi:hypothetical protein